MIAKGTLAPFVAPHPEWILTKLKFIGNVVCGGTPSTEKQEYWNGYIPWLQSGKVQFNRIELSDVEKFISERGLYESSTKIVKANSVLVAITGATCGNIAYLPFDSAVNQSVVGIEPNDLVLPEFVYYYLISQTNRILINRSGGAQAGVSKEDIKNIVIIVPPLPEQRSIARFLDDKTAKIDTLIEKKRRLIELLKEERQAVINCAVTKGMNPDAKMKPSGIEWLGDVPEGWKPIKLKRVCDRITDGEHISPTFLEEGIPFLSAKDVRERKIDYNVDKFVTPEFAAQYWKRCKPERGDLLIVSRGATIGRIALVEEDKPFCLLGSVILLKPKFSAVDAIYLYYLLNHSKYKESLYMTSGSSAQQAIYLVDVAELETALPELGDQLKIGAFLETKTNEIATLIEKAERAIALLTEYRTALITEAVTGKIQISN